MGLAYPSNKICPRCGTSGYVWYLDNSEFVAKCTNCGHYFRREDFPIYVLDEAPKPITNADRIRAMTDEELADFLGSIIHDYGQGTAEIEGAGYLIDDWFDWLKEEVKVEYSLRTDNEEDNKTINTEEADK